MVLCGPLAALMDSSEKSSLDTWYAQVVEGGRLIKGPRVTASNIVDGEVQLGADCSHAVSKSGRNTVQTGDVLLSKAPPVKAAWVAPSVGHRLFDATCYAIRNLNSSQGIWLTFCLNQRQYTSALLRRSVASSSPRINSKQLRQFPIPNLPAGFDLLADGIVECMDQRALSSLELLQLQRDVAQYVDSLIPDPAIQSVEDHALAMTWYRPFSAALIEDSLLPNHVKAGVFQQILRSSGDWQPIKNLVSMSHGRGERLPKEVRHYLSLRLSDVGTDLRVPGNLAPGQAGNRNVYAAPLAAGEVLHSLLATNPRTVFVSETPSTTIFPTDHWVRLRFNETPGAWALTMQTEPVARQLRSMTTGLTQQFAAASAVEQLVLPPIPLAIRMSWDGRLRRLQRQRDELDAIWQELVDRVYKLLKHTEVRYGPWVSPFYEGMRHDA